MPVHTGQSPAPPVMHTVGLSRPPAHTWSAAHMPQSTRLPHMSSVYPHAHPRLSHVSVGQPPSGRTITPALPPVAVVPPEPLVPPVLVPEAPPFDAPPVATPLGSTSAVLPEHAAA